jgi:hypothetical protein
MKATIITLTVIAFIIWIALEIKNAPEREED